MPKVRIPTPLRNLTDGAAEIEVDAGDLRGVIDQLDAEHPGLADRLLDDEGELRRFVNVFVRDEDVRFQEGLDTAVGESDTVSIVPAVAGGADRAAERRGSTHGAARLAGGADRAAERRGSTHGAA